MKSIFVLTCCLALAIVTEAADNEHKGKKKGGGGQGGQSQQVQPQGGGGKHGRMGRQGMGNAGQLNGPGKVNAGKGRNASQGLHRGLGKGQGKNLPAVQSNVKGGKFQARHFALSNGPNPKIASVTFNQHYRIGGAEHWVGPRYEVFRLYQPAWHDRVWWVGHYPRVVLIGGGWYYWNSGFWYPAWGYDAAAAYYPYDGPIYAYNDLPPDQVIANVQTALKDQRGHDGEPYYKGDVDGLLGPLTRAALAEYQSDHDLTPTSAVDQPTMESLGFA